MADVESAVRSTLLAHAGTSALVSTRVWYDQLPQNPTYPAVTVQQISGERPSAMGDDVGVGRGTIQVDAWAANRSDMKSLAEQTRDAMQRFRGTATNGTVIHESLFRSEFPLNDPEVHAWRMCQQFYVTWGE